MRATALAAANVAETANNYAAACARNERDRRFESISLRQRVTANRYPVVASFRVGTATAERLTQCE